MLNNTLLKRVALYRVSATRFRPLFLCMSLSQSPLHTFGRHAFIQHELEPLEAPGIHNAVKLTAHVAPEAPR
jgi:hypothetical protein